MISSIIFPLQSRGSDDNKIPENILNENPDQQKRQQKQKVEAYALLPFKENEVPQGEKYTFTWGKKVKNCVLEMEEGSIDFAEHIQEMINNEKNLSSLHNELKKENIAQYKFLVIDKHRKADSFCCLPLGLPTPLESSQKAICFYPCGTLAKQYPDFSYLEDYPCISQSTKDKNILLFQRPYSRTEATQHTINLLLTLVENPSAKKACPATVFPHVLNSMKKKFESFNKERGDFQQNLDKLVVDIFRDIEKNLQNPDLIENKSLKKSISSISKEIKLSKEDISALTATFRREIKNLRYTPEGKTFLIRKKLLIEKLNEEIEKLKKGNYLSLYTEIETLKLSPASKELLISKKKELDNKEDILLLRQKKAVMMEIFEIMYKKYKAYVTTNKFDTLCNSKQFNFACSEQLVLDHLFDSQIETVVANVHKYITPDTKVLVFLLHSTMAPCKTCSLVLALEMIRQDGRIKNFFELLEGLSKNIFKKLVLVSYAKAYNPEEEEKKYGFDFENVKEIYANSTHGYFLVDFSPSPSS